MQGALIVLKIQSNNFTYLEIEIEFNLSGWNSTRNSLILFDLSIFQFKIGLIELEICQIEFNLSRT